MKLPTKNSPVRLYQGDCLHMLRKLPDACAHAIVQDPPAGIGFMGREWDDYRRSKNVGDSSRDSVFGRASSSAPQIGRGGLGAMRNFVAFLAERMVEALRVTVPGGLAITWAHPKTSDWTSLAMREAGWERVGWVLHLFGGGMPKGFLAPRLAAKAGISAERRKHLMTTFRVPSVEPWLVFRKSGGSQTENLRDHGTGYFPIGDYRVPRKARPLVTHGERGETIEQSPNTSSVYGRSSHTSGTTNEGSLPKDVELVCSSECGDEHVEGCPVRSIALAGRVGKNGTGCFVKESAGRPSSAYTLGEGKEKGTQQTTYGDSGDCSRYFHRHGQDVGEAALGVWSTKAKAQLRISTENATEADLRKGWRLFVRDADGTICEFPHLDAWNRLPEARVRIRSTRERHAGCEHLFWRRDASSPVGWRRVSYGVWYDLAKSERGHGNVHPTVKPQALIRPLVATATGNVEDPLVVDPFSGSGAIAQACLALGCRVVTAEQDPIVGWPILTAKIAATLKSAQ